VAGVVLAAATGAVHNHNMDRSRLYISKLFIGHGTHLKRLDIKGRGRTGIKLKYRSHLFCELQEQGADPSRYKGSWKSGGRSHDKFGREIRIGRIGPRISTIQRTLEHMKEWRTARGLPGARTDRSNKEQLAADVARAYRAQGIATDFDLIYGRQDPAITRSVPVKGTSGQVTTSDKTAAALAELEKEEDAFIQQQEAQKQQDQ